MRTRKVKPRNESRKKMRPYTRDAFHALLKRPITTPVQKPSAGCPTLSEGWALWVPHPTCPEPRRALLRVRFSSSERSTVLLADGAPAHLLSPVRGDTRSPSACALGFSVAPACPELRRASARHPRLGLFVAPPFCSSAGVPGSSPRTSTYTMSFAA